MRDIFGVAKISNIFWGCLKFLIFFGGEWQMLGPSLRMQKKIEYPPGILTCENSCKILNESMLKFVKILVRFISYENR